MRWGTELSLIHISEPTRPERISYAVFCLKKKRKRKKGGKKEEVPITGIEVANFDWIV